VVLRLFPFRPLCYPLNPNNLCEGDRLPRPGTLFDAARWRIRLSAEGGTSFFSTDHCSPCIIPVLSHKRRLSMDAGHPPPPLGPSPSLRLAAALARRLAPVPRAVPGGHLGVQGSNCPCPGPSVGPSNRAPSATCEAGGSRKGGSEPRGWT